MKWDPEVHMTAGAWLFALLAVVSTVFYAVVCLWALLLLARWFVFFWYTTTWW